MVEFGYFDGFEEEQLGLGSQHSGEPWPIFNEFMKKNIKNNSNNIASV